MNGLMRPAALSFRDDPPTVSRPERTYPHRLTVDLADDDYDLLRRLSYECRISMSEIVRRCIAELRT